MFVVSNWHFQLTKASYTVLIEAESDKRPKDMWFLLTRVDLDLMLFTVEEWVSEVERQLRGFMNANNSKYICHLR